MSRAGELLREVERLSSEYGVDSVKSALELSLTAKKTELLMAVSESVHPISGGSNGAKDPARVAAAKRMWATRRANAAKAAKK